MNANAHDYRLNPQVHEDRWISCEKCRAWMMPLAKYDLEEGEWQKLEDSGSSCTPGYG